MDILLSLLLAWPSWAGPQARSRADAAAPAVPAGPVQLAPLPQSLPLSPLDLPTLPALAPAPRSAAPAALALDARVEAVLATEPRFPETSRLDIAAGTIDGIPAARLKNIGADNRGVYSFQRDGEARILKILDYSERGMMKGLSGAREQLTGARLGELFDGPSVRRAGLLEGLDSERLFFIEMPELFPGRLSYSLKELYALADHGDVEDFHLLSRPAGRMGRMLAEVLERGIVPKDPDFLVSEDGEVAWLDANQWYRPEDPTSPDEVRQASHQIRSLARRMASGPGPAGREFLVSFLSGLKASPRLSDRHKRALLREAFYAAPGSQGKETVDKAAARVAAAAGLSGAPYPAITALYDSLPDPR